MDHIQDYSISHLLLMRPSGMSETALLAPVAGALRDACPALRITVLTQARFRPFFDGIADIGFVDYIPGEHKKAPMLRQLVREILERGINAVADLEDSDPTRTVRKILFNCGADVSVITPDRHGEKELTRRTHKHLTPLVPLPEMYRRTVAALGIDFELPAQVSRRERPLPDDIATLTGPKKGVWIGVAPFSRHKSKIYPIPLTDELIGILSSRYDRVFILGAGEHERSFAEGMEKRHRNTVSLVGTLAIESEMDVMANLDAVVSMDSAVMHIASLVGTPVVSVWGSTHPYGGGYGFGQDPANAVQLDMACRPCSIGGERRCIFGRHHCLTDIAPETIAKKTAQVVDEPVAEKILQSTPKPTKRPKAADHKKPKPAAPKTPS